MDKELVEKCLLPPEALADYGRAIDCFNRIPTATLIAKEQLKYAIPIIVERTQGRYE